jgi:hypothetical protein
MASPRKRPSSSSTGRKRRTASQERSDKERDSDAPLAPKRRYGKLERLRRLVPSAKTSLAVEELGESHADWDAFLRRVFERFSPTKMERVEDAAEAQLIWELAWCYWRLGRLLAAEVAEIRGQAGESAGLTTGDGAELVLGSGALEGFEEAPAREQVASVEAWDARTSFDAARRAALEVMTSGKLTRAIKELTTQRGAILRQLCELRTEKRDEDWHHAAVAQADRESKARSLALLVDHGTLDRTLAVKTAGELLGLELGLLPARDAEDNDTPTRPGGLAGGPASTAPIAVPLGPTDTPPNLDIRAVSEALPAGHTHKLWKEGSKLVQPKCEVCGLPVNQWKAYPECSGEAPSTWGEIKRREILKMKQKPRLPKEGA